jgi:hypothetical protein
VVTGTTRIRSCDCTARRRLNATSAIGEHLDDPQLASAVTRWLANVEPALAKLETFMAEIPPPGQDRAGAAP